MFRTARTAAAAVLLLAALSGCSLITALNDAPTAQPTPTEALEGQGSEGEAAGGQTAEEACDLLLPVLIDMNTRMTAAYGELQKSGPEEASALLHDISDDLHTTLTDITNDEVLGVTSTAVDSLDEMIAEIDAIIDGHPDQAALLDASQAVNDDFSAIDPVCQAATE